MNERTERKSRRELFRMLGRYLTLGGLAVFGGMAFQRSRRLQSNEPCRNIAPCQSCRVFTHCSLPPALNLRQTSQEGNRGTS
ncbi:MAG: hypothetical protein ACOX5R_16655 [bacterium]|jgi:hypothetical protein